MQPKRILIMILVVILAVLSAGIPISAEGDTTLDMAVEVSSSTALSNQPFVVDEGDYVTVSVTINKNPGFKMASFKILYDSEFLVPEQEGTALKWTKSELFPDCTETVTLKDGKIIYLLSESSTNQTATGKIFSCRFRVMKHGTTEIVFDMDTKDSINANNEPAASAVNILYVNDPTEDSVFVQVHTFGNTPEHVNATCTESGKNIYTCDVCGGKAKVNLPAEPATGHTEKEIPEIKPTCKTDGMTQGIVCAVCEEVLQNQYPIPAGDQYHTVVVLPGVDATCTETGMTEGQYCSVCEAVLLEQTETPKAEHAYGDWVDDAENGIRTKTCSACGDKLTDSLASNDGPDLFVIILIVAVVVLAAALTAAIIVVIRLKKKTTNSISNDIS